MKIIWLGKRFYTNKDTIRERFGRMYRLPLHWQEAGSQVHLWLVDYHHRGILYTNEGGMTIVSTPVFGFGMLRQMMRSMITGRADCIVASGDCYLGLLGWLIARMSGAAFVFDLYDKYDEFAGYRRLAGFDPMAFLLRHADGLLFASHVLAGRLAGAVTPMHVAPNGVDPSHFKPRDMLECRSELNLPKDGIFVGYFGSMEPDRGVADLIDAVIRVRETGIPVQLLLAGRKEPGIAMAYPWLRYLGEVPHNQIPALLNACDLVAIPYRNGPYVDMIASCKIAEYLACQRPLVATSNPGFMANYASQAAAMGEALCHMSDPADMARALLYQLKSRSVPAPVPNMDWQHIAGETLRWLEPIVAHRHKRR